MNLSAIARTLPMALDAHSAVTSGQAIEMISAMSPSSSTQSKAMQGKKRWLALLAVVVATGGILAVVGYYLGSWYVLLALLLLVVLDEFIALWLFQVTSKPALTGMEAMIGKVATVITDFQAVDGGKPQGKVRFNGEIWSAEAKPEDASKLSSGSKVSICSVSGLLLKVKASNDGPTPTPD